MKFPYIVINIAVILLNPWWWIIIGKDFTTGVLIFILSLHLIVFFLSKNFKFSLGNRSFSLTLPILILTLLIVSINVKQGFDESLFKVSQLDIQKFYRRHESYGQNLGKLYKNKFSISYFKIYQPPLFKLRSNFSENLDFNLYFFSNHPREREGVDEFKKYLPIFLPFFIVGILYAIYRPSLKMIVYATVIVIISSLISPQYKLGPVLIFPIINYLLCMGIIFTTNYLPKELKNVLKL